MATELTSSKTHEVVEEVEAEELELQVNQALHLCTKDELIFLAKGLTIPKAEIEGKSHLSLIKHVSKFVESMRGLSLGDEDKSIEHLFKILETIESLRTSFRGEVPVAEKRKDTIPAAEDEPEEKPLQSATRRRESTAPTPDFAEAAGKAYFSHFIPSLREFKIIGSIGKKGEKDKLTFGGLCLQLKQAETKGIRETEIVLAVIRAMSPTLSLRKMLEVRKEDMSLSKLKKLLRAHFEEPRVSDIHKELQAISQFPGENTIEFVWRAYEMSARLQIASEDEGEEGTLNFSAEQIKRILHEAIDSGVQEENVRKELRKIMSVPNIEIDEISTRLQTVLIKEKTRAEKLGKTDSKTPTKDKNTKDSRF